MMEILNNTQCPTKSRYCKGGICIPDEPLFKCPFEACPNGTLPCDKNIECYTPAQRCDGISHCIDHTDELGCHEGMSWTKSETFIYCSAAAAGLVVLVGFVLILIFCLSRKRKTNTTGSVNRDFEKNMDHVRTVEAYRDLEIPAFGEFRRPAAKLDENLNQLTTDDEESTALYDSVENVSTKSATPEAPDDAAGLPTLPALAEEDENTEVEENQPCADNDDLATEEVQGSADDAESSSELLTSPDDVHLPAADAEKLGDEDQAVGGTSPERKLTSSSEEDRSFNDTEPSSPDAVYPCVEDVTGSGTSQAETDAEEDTSSDQEESAIETALLTEEVGSAEGSPSQSVAAEMVDMADEEVQQTADEFHSPTDEVHPPAEEVHSPDEEVPSTADEVHSTAEDHSPAEEVHPATEDQSPAEEVHPTAEEVYSPAEEVQQPAEEVLSPAEEVHPPAEEVHSPAEEVPPSDEEVHPPSEVPSPAEVPSHAEVHSLAEEDRLPTEEVAPSIIDTTLNAGEVSPPTEAAVPPQEELPSPTEAAQPADETAEKANSSPEEVISDTEVVPSDEQVEPPIAKSTAKTEEVTPGTKEVSDDEISTDEISAEEVDPLPEKVWASLQEIEVAIGLRRKQPVKQDDALTEESLPPDAETEVPRVKLERDVSDDEFLSASDEVDTTSNKTDKPVKVKAEKAEKVTTSTGATKSGGSEESPIEKDVPHEDSPAQEATTDEEQQPDISRPIKTEEDISKAEESFMY